MKECTRDGHRQGDLTLDQASGLVQDPKVEVLNFLRGQAQSERRGGGEQLAPSHAGSLDTGKYQDTSPQHNL